MAIMVTVSLNGGGWIRVEMDAPTQEDSHPDQVLTHRLLAAVHDYSENHPGAVIRSDW